VVLFKRTREYLLKSRSPSTLNLREAGLGVARIIHHRARRWALTNHFQIFQFHEQRLAENDPIPLPFPLNA
jgi:hypothetical protein